VLFQDLILAHALVEYLASITRRTLLCAIVYGGALICHIIPVGASVFTV